MITAAVCDDEPVLREQLIRQLTEYMAERGVPCRVSGFSGGQALLEWGEEFDLVLLDIQMAPPDGMETARQLRARGAEGLILFVTVLRERVFDAFQVEAFDYLVKPLEDASFRRTMDRALRVLEERRAKTLLVQRGGLSRVVPLAQIRYAEVLDRKVYLHLRDGDTLDYYSRMESLEKQADGRFFRCHRSYLVNLACVRRCAGGRITLERGEEIPLSRLREQAFTRALLRYMKERRG